MLTAVRGYFFFAEVGEGVWTVLPHAVTVPQRDSDAMRRRVAGLKPGAGGKRQDAVQTILFFCWQFLDPENPSVTFGDSSPKRGAKGGDFASPRTIKDSIRKTEGVFLL